MRRVLALTAALTVLGLAACGGDDEESDSGATGATGATGPADVSSASGSDLSTEDFIAASLPDQVSAVEDAVAANSDCEGVDAEPGSDFQVGVAIAAAEASPQTPIAEVVGDRCAQE